MPWPRLLPSEAKVLSVFHLENGSASALVLAFRHGEVADRPPPYVKNLLPHLLQGSLTGGPQLVRSLSSAAAEELP